LVITSFVVALAAESSVGSSQRALAAMSARYQAMAEHDALSGEAQLDQYWSATADRYQALADAYLSEQSTGIEAGWAATAARYQALADHDALSGEAQLDKYWSATADRYHKGIEAGWLATAARYQALADHDALSGEAQLDQYWSATAERYQAMADAYLSEQSTGIEASPVPGVSRLLPIHGSMSFLQGKSQGIVDPQITISHRVRFAAGVL
jgi:hypothetical protein